MGLPLISPIPYKDTLKSGKVAILAGWILTGVMNGFTTVITARSIKVDPVTNFPVSDIVAKGKLAILWFYGVPSCNRGFSPAAFSIRFWWQCENDANGDWEWNDFTSRTQVRSS
jgi:hypothetical protein